MSRSYSLLLLFLSIIVFEVKATAQTGVDTEIASAIESYLINELNDSAIAKELAQLITVHFLNWKPFTIDISQVDSIAAYAFGNRILPNGNHLPGPVNEALADLVVELYKKIEVPVYAQWEIAQAIGERIPLENMVVINPRINAFANVEYLSTAGVASAIAGHFDDPKKLGKVAVVAFNDHQYRCIQTSCNAGMDAFAPEGYAMPSMYDPLSGQPWTRNRLAYLVTDLKMRIAQCAEGLY